MEHLDQKGLAKRWLISPRTLEQWRWQGRGPRYLKIGGRVVYRLSDVEVFEAASVHANTVSPLDDGHGMRLVMEAAEKGRLHDGKDSNDLAARTASGLAYATAARGWPAEDLGGRRIIKKKIEAALGDDRSEARS
jgi:hypothetical protein